MHGTDQPGTTTAAETAQEKAREAKDEARSRVQTQLDERSTQAGRQVGEAASAFQRAAEELRTQGKDGPAQLAETAAERMQRTGRWLEQSTGDDLLGQLEDFGRRQPWAVALGGLALGFAASRLVKASSDRRAMTAGTSDGSRQQRPLPSGPAPGAQTGTAPPLTGAPVTSPPAASPPATSPPPTMPVGNGMTS